jgi:N-acetylneuraminic acid mutarotase
MILLILAVLVIMTITSCHKESAAPLKTVETEGLVVGLPPPIIFWAKGPDLPFTDQIPGDVPIGREFPQGFAINGKGYLCGGVTLTGWETGEYINDLWEYDTATRSWSQKAYFPGSETIEADNFVIGNSAYMCNGYDNENWEYNQTANTWTRRADVPSVPRALAVGMAINGKGYVGLGTYDATNPAFKDTKDWWQYDPLSDAWTRKADFPGGRRDGAAGFVVNGKGYVCSGTTANGSIYYTDLWQYNPTTDVWTQKADFPGAGRWQSSGFSGIDYNYGYVACGESSSAGLNDCWEYNPANNKWASLPNVPGVRAAAAAFTIGRTLFIASGYNRKDFWGLTLPNP